MKTKLCPNPTRAPLFAQKIQSKKYGTINVGDPDITRALVAMMNFHAVVGGAACHWGGPAALAEINSALHGLMLARPGQWHQNFNYVNDVGHAENGVYALRANLGMADLTLDSLKGFRSINSKLTGHGESHIFPEGVLISNGPLGSAFPQAQGLCIADRLSGHSRTTICLISDGASMEGEAKEAFSSIPGLASKGKMNPFVAILSDNNTKLSGRIEQDTFSMAPYFRSLETQGWRIVHLENGHDLQLVANAIEEAIQLAENNPHVPVCIWAKTIKGKGVKKTEDAASGGHGYPIKAGDQKALREFIGEILKQKIPSEIESWLKQIEVDANKVCSNKNSPPSAVKLEKVQDGVKRALDTAMAKGHPIVSVSADLQGSTGMAPFHQNYPQRSFDIGVAESNMISVAAGLSLHGQIPIVDTFAQFGVTKGNLPLTMAALGSAPVIALFSHTGMQDAADGASHQATSYFAQVSSIPHTQVISLATSKEAEVYLQMAIEKMATRKSTESPDSVIFFLGREIFVPEITSFQGQTNYTWGRPQLITQDPKSKIILVATGPLVHQLPAIKEKLNQAGVSVTTINHSFINHFDVTFYRDILEKSERPIVVTLEDHQIIGGMGQMLFAKLLEQDLTFKGRNLGLTGHFGRSAYQAEDLYQLFGLGVDAITQKCLALLS